MTRLRAYSKVGWMLLTCFVLIGFLLQRQSALVMGAFLTISWTSLKIIEEGLDSLQFLTRGEKIDKIDE